MELFNSFIMNKITVQEKSPKSKIYSKFDNDDYKKCPCGKQNKIPFKLGYVSVENKLEPYNMFKIQNSLLLIIILMKTNLISYYSVKI